MHHCPQTGQVKREVAKDIPQDVFQKNKTKDKAVTSVPLKTSTCDPSLTQSDSTDMYTPLVISTFLLGGWLSLRQHDDEDMSSDSSCPTSRRPTPRKKKLISAPWVLQGLGAPLPPIGRASEKGGGQRYSSRCLPKEQDQR